MRFWLDTEFIEDGKTIELISIAFVAEDGRELYCENKECDLSRANDWVKENVLKHLYSAAVENRREGNAFNRDGGRGGLMTRAEIAREVRIFLDPDTYGKPEIWGYYADYDWVVFCQLFGMMIDLPKGFPMFCMDIRQRSKEMGDIELPNQDSGEHHALNDARWNKLAWEYLERRIAR